MATGYIEACQPLPWRQSFDPGPYAWTWSGWRRYGSPSGETEPTTSGSGEAKLARLGIGWSCSRALDCSDESMSMAINFSYSGTLVLIPDTIFYVNPQIWHVMATGYIEACQTCHI